MPDHKNQHYVPRCHLKPFSVSMAGKAINLLHIKSGKLIRNAPVRSQCSKDYFYGDDLVLEKQLQSIEGRYASAIRQIIENETVDDETEEFLRDFSYLQYLRTDIAVRRTLLAQEDMASLIYEGVSENKKPTGLSKRELVEMTINTFFETVSHISDLKICILKNDTKIPLVTSDDPAIVLNRFYAQRLGPRWKASGIGNAGVMLVLPLSSKFAVYSYDGDVYTCTDRVERFVKIKNDADVKALNALQFVKASNSVYFFEWADGDRIKEEFNAFASKRPEKWHELHYAIKDESQEHSGSTRFRVVHTASERLNAKEALIHLEQTNLDPGVWCSKIKFRPKPIFVDTKSGAGYVRRRQFG